MKSLHDNARLIFALWLAATIALGTKPLSAFEDSPAALTFEKDVRPIFKAHCFLDMGFSRTDRDNDLYFQCRPYTRCQTRGLLA